MFHRVSTYFQSFRYMQYLSVISASLIASSSAAYGSWSSPALPHLTSLSSEQASWVISIYALGSLPGGILGGWLLDIIGRKRTILLATITHLLPWIAIGLSDVPSVLIIARLIGGTGTGIAVAVTPIYIAEVADKDIRGRLSTVYIIFSISGSVIMLSVGPFLKYYELCFIGATFSVLCALTFAFLPESPYYFIRNQKKDQARHNLLLLSGKNVGFEVVEERFKQMVTTIEKDMKERFSARDLIRNKDYRKPLLLIIGLKTIHQMSGYNAINGYMETIMKLSQTGLSSHISSVIYGTIQLPSAVISAFLVDKLGRKTLLIISTVGCGTALVCEGVYFYLLHLETVDLTSLYWFPTFALTMFIMMVPIGTNTIPYVMVGELFTTNVKRAAGTIFTVYGGSLAFIVVKVFSPLAETIGIYAVFWMFACVCFLGTLFGIFILPETKGRSFQEIQELLNKR